MSAWGMKNLSGAQKVAAINLVRGAFGDRRIDAETTDAMVMALADAELDILPTTPPPPPPPDAWARLTEEQRESVRSVLLNASRVSTISASELAAAFERLGLR